MFMWGKRFACLWTISQINMFINFMFNTWLLPYPHMIHLQLLNYLPKYMAHLSFIIWILVIHMLCISRCIFQFLFCIQITNIDLSFAFVISRLFRNLINFQSMLWCSSLPQTTSIASCDWVIIEWLFIHTCLDHNAVHTKVIWLENSFYLKIIMLPTCLFCHCVLSEMVLQ